MQLNVLFLLPIVGALIGWLTNWLAVKMIFRPREARTFLGIRIQGLLPRRREALATSIAETVETELLSVEDIQEIVKEVTEGPRVRGLIHERIASMIEQQLEKLNPMVKGFLGPELLEKITGRLEEEVLSFLGELGDEVHAGIERHVDIREMVANKIRGFDMAKLEDIVLRIASKELRFIEVLGGILGFLVGMAEVGLLLLA